MLVTIQDFASAFFILGVFAFFYVPIFWFFLSIITPKKVLNQYFREPHFSLTEIHLMREFPGFLIRTAIFGWITVFPSLDRKRNLKNLPNELPVWYSVLLQLLIISSQLLLLIFIFFFISLEYLLNNYNPEDILFRL